MYGRHTFRPRHGGWLVADHLLQVIFVAFALPLFAQESGDGFSESDRAILRDVRTIATGNSTKLTTIQQVVQDMSPTVDQIQSDVEDIADELSEIKSAQSYFNNVQYNMKNMLDNWNTTGLPGTEDLPLIQQNTYNAATHLSYIRSDVSDISDNTTQMNGHLLNIDRETTESSDYLHSIDQNVQYLASLVERLSTNRASTVDISAISNAISQLNVSSPVDMGMVTNLYLSLMFPYDMLVTESFDDYPSFLQWFNYYTWQTGNVGPYVPKYARFLGHSSFGLLMALMDSALISDTSIPKVRNPWVQASQYWFGSSHSDFQYSIFDAYNTLGLGVLTNQANTLIGQGDYVTNSLAVIVSNLVASLSVAEKTKDALYYPEDSETIYETTNHYSIPEWEPTYHAGIAENTNYYYYFQQADTFTRSLIGNYTNLLGRVIGGINPQHRDWDAKITWSGWPSMQGQYGGWDLDVRLPDTSDVVDFAKYIKFLSRLVCFVLDLCIVLLGATRIHKTVMGGKLPFEQ